jgi:hypothetical protein
MSVDVEFNALHRGLCIDLPNPETDGELLGLDSLTERYLYTHGNLEYYYRHMATGAAAGQAFFYSLSGMDKYRVRLDFPSDLKKEEYQDQKLVLSAIRMLLDTEENYPENHPLRKLAEVD